MKKTLLTLFSLFLVLTMVAGVFASCTAGSGNETESSSQKNESESSEADSSEKESSEKSEDTSKEEDNSDTDEGTGENPGGNEEIIGPAPSKHNQLIQTANGLANGVQAYFSDASRTHFVLQNHEMKMNYARSNRFDQLVASLQNTKGAEYVKNTMDAYVRMADGSTFYASQSAMSAEANLYRFGYYYYEALFEFQNFVPKDFEIENEAEIDVRNQFGIAYGLTRGKEDGKAISFVINDTTDPRFIYNKNFSYNTADYNVLVIRAKAIGSCNSAQLFINTGKNYNEAQSTSFSLINDGEYYDYYIPLFSMDSYEGTLTGLRFDPTGGIGSGIAIESMTLGYAEFDNIPDSLSTNRHFHVYSDKMHHAIQFAVTERLEGIAEIGMLTEIPADTVSKLIVVMDDGTTHDSLNAGFDWADVVAVGFDITDAGVFGFILPKYDDPAEDIGGKLSVELKDGVYVIEQARTPSADGVAGVIIPSIDTEKKDDHGNYVHAAGVKNNGNDQYLGQRIYTDENHDFDEFLKETGFERNPLTDKRVNISFEDSDSGEFNGYDPMRGIYILGVGAPSGGFYAPYNNPGKDYKVNFSIRSDIDRDIYIMTANGGGLLECATLMDEEMMLLPIPIEVIKNFSEAEGERNLYNISDPGFSEAIFVLSLNANEKQEYTLINLYQNWGKYPLKQLSQIPFHCPYYHLSTGVTETNCILPWFGTANVGKGGGNTLPDFRSMSAPFWKTQPQHNSCGTHNWLAYTDSDGKYSMTECTENIITSHGPTYAEVVWNNLSDDGKIKVTYTHMEMPQTDENRSYYTMEYEFLENVTINNFKDNFRFYDVTDNNATGTYKKVGYLNEQNESVVVDSNQDAEAAPEYVLGKDCPYFSFFMMPDWNRNSTSAEGYSNVALLIHSSEFIVGGEKQDYSFLIKNPKDHVSLTLNIADTVEFKAGDKITINAILLPWGSQQYEDDPANRLSDAHAKDYTTLHYSMELEDGTLYMDKNVRDVRENTCLNPLTVKSETDEVLASPFLPKIRSKDGKTAEFTLSGGMNNVTVRISGLRKLTAPKVQELVDGKWVDYILSSYDTPDERGNYHYYDGYQVQYEEDGTYAYSFVTTMNGKDDRTFRISAEADFVEWPREQEPPAKEDLLNIFIDNEELHELISYSSHMYGTPVIDADENGPEFTSVYVKLDNGYKESYSTIYTTHGEGFASGQYFVIKYRVPKSNTENLGAMQIWTSTTLKGAGDAGSLSYSAMADGKWHVDVIDLSKSSLKFYTPDKNGEFWTQFLRVDFFNKQYADGENHIDIAYIGIDSDLERICQLEAENFKTITLYENGSAIEIDTQTGAQYVRTYIDPSSGYTQSTEMFGCTLDYVSGQLVQTTSSTPNGEIVTINNATVNSELTIKLAGWCAVNGGVEKYVYSYDSGKTWHDCTGTPKEAHDDIVKVGQRYAGGTDYAFDDFEASRANGNFQGGGLSIDLKACAGETVDVIFAAVPKKNTQSLVLLFYFPSVDCSTNSVFDPDSAYTEIEIPHAALIDFINGATINKSANSQAGMLTFSDEFVISDGKVNIAGWCVVSGGTEKYVWTADGGKTWHDFGGSIGDANDGMLSYGQSLAGTTFSDPNAAAKNGNFAGANELIADLSEYAGSEAPLDIYFCVVPATATDRVIVLYRFTNVIVP